MMGQLRAIVNQNKDQAMQLLTQNPQLCAAFLRMQVTAATTLIHVHTCTVTNKLP
jgi:hypothetical protein